MAKILYPRVSKQIHILYLSLLYLLCCFQNVPISFENYQRIFFRYCYKADLLHTPTRTTCTSNLSLQNHSRQSQAGNTRDYLADSVKQLEQTHGICVMSSAHRPSSHSKLYNKLLHQDTEMQASLNLHTCNNFYIPFSCRHFKTKHWLIRNTPHPMKDSSINASDSIFRNRFGKI